MPSKGGQDGGTPMNSEVQQPLKFGQVLQLSLQVLRDNFIQFYLVGLAVGIPTLILTAILPPDSPITVTNILEGILSQFATGALTYGSYQYLRGQAVSASSCLRYAAQNFGRLIGLAFLTGILISLGLVLLIVPGIILATMFAVAVPALLAERLSVSDSIKRSAALTKGYRWQVFGLVLLTMIGMLGGAFLIGFILVLADLAYDGLGVDDFLLWLWVGLYYTVSAVISATLYHRLREVKEGLGIEQLAAVFD